MSDMTQKDYPDEIPTSRAARADCVSPEHFDAAVGRMLGGIVALRGDQSELLAAIEQAVAAGIRRAVTDPSIWAEAGEAMRTQAQSAAGGWLIGGVRSLVTRAAWVIAAIAAVYALGGWGAVVAFLKAGSAGGH